MSADPISAPIFSGEYRHALDPKNRITIPAAWRRTDADEFFLAPRGETHLSVMPPDEFRATADRAKAHPAVSQAELAAFLRHFYSSAQRVTLDKQGRLLVPDEFCKRLNLRGEVILAGILDKFEIWSAESWKAVQMNDKPTVDSVARLVGL